MAKANVMIDNQKTRVTEWSFEVGDSTGQHIHEYDCGSTLVRWGAKNC